MQEILITLAEHLNLTSRNDEQEPYLLTEQEEIAIFENKIAEEKKHLTWKLAQSGFSMGEILQRLSAINWDEKINKQEIFSRANSSKNYDIWQREQREQEKQDALKRDLELKALWTAKRMYNLMAFTSEDTYGKKLVVNPDNEKLIKAICFFLSGDERFETELNFSLKKGLMIRGVSGLGKTHLVKCVADNELKPISILSMIEICNQIKSEGHYSVEYKNCKVIYLDDVGTEESTVSFFGNKINWFKDFLEMYYLKNKPFNHLIISTNNTFSEIEEKYGYRVRSRVKDVFNIIDVAGKDMRG